MIHSSGGHSQTLRSGYAQANHSKLAGNMILSEAPKGSKTAGVVMQVNKYVPYYNRIPKIEKKDFTMFTYGINNEAEQQRYENKIRPAIQQFDRVLVDSLMQDRDIKYNRRFRPELMEDS